MNQAPNIQNLLKKFVENDCTPEEINTIINYLKQVEVSDDLPDFDEVLKKFKEIPSIEPQRAKDIYHNILTTALCNKQRFWSKKIWRYAAAAVIVGVMASTYILKDTLFRDNVIESVPATVNSPILPGSDKATLTLEDGTQIVLEEGTPYQYQNVSSNGKEIIYTSQTTNNKQQTTTNILTIPRGGQFQLTLADGTRVWLNSETQLKYPVTFINGESRQVELVYGEAYFDVSPSIEHNGANFNVLHKQQEIKVLGTEFNIKAYSDELNIYTTLAEGKVAINYLGKTQNLIPGQQSQVNTLTNTLSVATVNIKTEVSWKDGIFSFKEKSLKEIMTSLSRWYDVDVVFKNKSLEDIRFNGVLRKHQNIEEILGVIMSNSINTYEINNKTIIFK